MSVKKECCAYEQRNKNGRCDNCGDPAHTYEHVNSPSHYNNYSKEVIDMMVDIYGTDKTIVFCEMNAFKYRMRLGTKPEQPIERDLQKEKWYLDKAEELRKTLFNG